MGLIQREIERAGIPTVGLSIVRRFSEKVRPPRTLFLDWPFGHPLGRPHNIAQHRAVLAEAFKALYGIREPGGIVDVSFDWGKQNYDDYDFLTEMQNIQAAQPWGGRHDHGEWIRPQGEQGSPVKV